VLPFAIGSKSKTRCGGLFNGNGFYLDLRCPHQLVEFLAPGWAIPSLNDYGTL
jgi:hypothetical protein